jgi:hypothetical protein
MKTTRQTDVTDDLDEMRDGFCRNLDEVRVELRRLAEQHDRLPYVRQELHDEQIRSLREGVERVASHTHWTFALLASSIIGAVVVLVITVAQSS